MQYQLGITLVLLILSSAVSAGKIYTWKDADGQVHFGSMPPPQVEVESTGRSTGTSTAAPARSESGQGKPLSIVERYKKIQNQQPPPTQMPPAHPPTHTNNHPPQPPRIEEKYRVNNAWKKEVIDKCKANRGVDCSNPRYVQSKRPLSEEERDYLNRERQQRRAIEAMKR